jgi:branched-chain amino acid transport system substrate-binding protein
VQIYAEALQALSQKPDFKQLSLAELRSQLNQQILKSKFDTPLGLIRFTPAGEVIQQQFYVAQIKMDTDGKNGKFVFLK